VSAKGGEEVCEKGAVSAHCRHDRGCYETIVLLAVVVVVVGCGGVVVGLKVQVWLSLSSDDGFASTSRVSE